MVVGEFTVETELAVIGGGPGGYSAAFRAAELGIETTLIDDRPRLGGTWLHGGCIPTKELLHIADVIRCAEHAADIGVDFSPPKIDLAKLRAGLAATAEEFADNLDALCRQHDVARVHGRARFVNSRELALTDSPEISRLNFRRAIIATGSCEIPLPCAPADSPRVLKPASALRLDNIPESLLIVGGSAVALELATVYATLGSRVTIVDRGRRPVKHADDDLIEPLLCELGRTLDGLSFGTLVTSMRDTGKAIEVEFEGDATPERAVYEKVIIAIGRRACTDGLGLENTRVDLNEQGYIVVNSQLHTSDPRILAVGDVVGDPMLALKATHQSRIAAEVAAGWGSEFDARVVPMVLFTDPQLAWCGITESEAQARGLHYGVQKTRWAAAGQTTGFRRTNGFTKIIYEPDAQVILGLGVVGPNAAELIAEGALAIEMGAVLTDIAATIHPHPTHSEFLCNLAQEAESAGSE
jgi:dihydrolipoamide dehydrogenase